jgi:hypothetical protein
MRSQLHRLHHGSTRRAIGLAGLLTVVSCALDERELRLGAGDGSSAGAFDGGGGPSGGSSPGNPGGDDPGNPGGNDPGNPGGNDGVNGGQPASAALVDGCADLDTDGRADCDATLVENASFTTTVDGWLADADATLTWDARNAFDDAPSGSLRLTTKMTQASAVQCLSLAGESVVIAYANAYVEATETQSEGRAVLAVTFFEREGCLGEGHAFFETPASPVIGEWSTLHAGGLSLTTTRSLSVALVGVKGASTDEQTWYFDNVMLKAQPP